MAERIKQTHLLRETFIWSATTFGERTTAGLIDSPTILLITLGKMKNYFHYLPSVKENVIFVCGIKDETKDYNLSSSFCLN